MNATPLSDSARKLRAFDLEFRKKARIHTHYGVPKRTKDLEDMFTGLSAQYREIHGLPPHPTHRKES